MNNIIPLKLKYKESIFLYLQRLKVILGISLFNLILLIFYLIVNNIILTIAVLITFSFVFIYLYNQNKINNVKKKIKIQKEIILKQQEELKTSILYASRIQSSFVQSDELLNLKYKDNFVYKKSDEIVSGDFYWIKEKNNKVIIALMGSSNYGVSGAIMSIFEISILNKIINESHMENVDNLILQFKKEIINTQSILDGFTSEAINNLDISFCLIDEMNNKIQYSGTRNPLYFISDESLYIINNESEILNDYYSNIKDSYFVKDTNYKKGDVIYLTTLGNYNKNFSKENEFISTKFIDLLKEIHKYPMIKQKEFLEINLKSLTKGLTQTGEISFLGIRF